MFTEEHIPELNLWLTDNTELYDAKDHIWCGVSTVYLGFFGGNNYERYICQIWAANR
jgi:hypothetical protein